MFASAEINDLRSATSIEVATSHSQNLREEKFKQDINNLISLRQLIIKMLRDEYNQTNLLSDCKAIGQLTYMINWDETDKTCIRNKHGYRNRHKEGGNKVHTEGAKLNFETLGYLKDVPSLSEDKADIIDSLKTINKKIDFILSKESVRLSEEQQSRIPDICTINIEVVVENSDIGFLLKLSAYHHDTESLDTILDYLTKFTPDEYKNVDLQNQLHRYYVGYLFTQIGEKAKEVSDFIKPEEGANLTRKLFNKLGHYRQEIKDYPIIVYGTDYARLFQMQQQLQKCLPQLVGFLRALQDKLLTFQNLDDLSEYSKFNIPGRLPDKEYVPYSLFEQTHNQAAIRNIIIDLGDGVKNLSKKIKSMSEHIATLEYDLDRDQKELGVKKGALGERREEESVQEQQPCTICSKIVDRGLFNTNKSKQLKKLLSEFLITYPDWQNNLLTNVSSAVDQKIKEKIGEKYVQRGKLITLKDCYSTVYNNLLKQFSEAEDLTLAVKNLTLSVFLNLLNNSASEHNDMTSEISNLECKIFKQEKNLKKTKQELNDTKEILEKLKKEMPQLSLGVINYTADNQQTKLDATQKTLVKLEHEVGFLKDIELHNNNNSPYVPYARKMSIGIIGQYLKVLFRDSDELREYASKDFLLRESITNIINIRSKYIMHGMRNDAEELVTKASKQALLPWQKSFESIKISLLYDKDCKDLIFKSLPKIPEWTEGGLKVEQDVYIKFRVMYAYNRLMQYEKTVEIYNKLEVQNYMLNEAHSPYMKFLLLSNYLDALSTLGDEEIIVQVSRQCLDIIEILLSLESKYSDISSPTLAETKSMLLGQILLRHKSLAIEVDINSLKRDIDKLALADNWLENGKYEDALGIIKPILETFNALHDESNALIGFNCYKLMSMYHRCQSNYEQALLCLQEVCTILEKYKEYFMIEGGGRIKYDFALQISTQASIYNSWGKSLIDNNHQKAEEKLQLGLKKGLEALKEYREAGESNHPLMLADVHRILAESYAFLGIIQSKNFSEFINIHLSHIESYLAKMTNPEKLMQICEIRIAMAEVCAAMGSREKYFNYLLLAYKNEHWNICADFLKVPKTFQLIQMPDPTTLTELEGFQVLLALNPNIQITSEQRERILQKITIEVDIQGLETLLSSEAIVMELSGAAVAINDEAP